MKNSNPVSEKAIKLGTLCYKQQLNNENEITAISSKSKYCQPAGRRKVVASSLREALYDWFIDAHGLLQVHFPHSLIKSKAKYFYGKWFNQ